MIAKTRAQTLTTRISSRTIEFKRSGNCPTARGLSAGGRSAIGSMHLSRMWIGVSGPKRDRRQELEGLSGLNLQMKSPRDRGQKKHGFHHGEVVADADSRAIAEGKIRRSGADV